MKMNRIFVKNKNTNYTIIIGKGSLGKLKVQINKLCPKTKKIVLIIDTKVPRKFKNIFKKKLKNYETFFFPFYANEKSKSFRSVEKLLQKILMRV